MADRAVISTATRSGVPATAPTRTFNDKQVSGVVVMPSGSAWIIDGTLTVTADQPDSHDTDMMEQLDCMLYTKGRSRICEAENSPEVGSWTCDNSIAPLQWADLFEKTDSAMAYLDSSWSASAERMLCVQRPSLLFESGQVILNCPETMVKDAAAASAFEIRPSGVAHSDSYESLLNRSLRLVNHRYVLEILELVNSSLAERIRHLGRLESDWDGYGGMPIEGQSIERTAILLITASWLGGDLEEPFVAPLPDGGLEIEWEVESGVELMLVVSPDGRDVEYLLEIPSDSGIGFDATEGFLTPTGTKFGDMIALLRE